jgi:hypothetical protein
MILKANTLENLVARAFSFVLCEDTIFLHNFIGSYRSFTTTEQMLDMLFIW